MTDQDIAYAEYLASKVEEQKSTIEAQSSTIERLRRHIKATSELDICLSLSGRDESVCGAEWKESADSYYKLTPADMGEVK